MCYSAQVAANYKKFVRTFGATMSIAEFYDVFWRRASEPDAKIRIPKAMGAAFDDPQTDDEARIRAEIAKYETQEATRLEQELFAQRKRLADAERILATKTTKAAS